MSGFVVTDQRPISGCQQCGGMDRLRFTAYGWFCRPCLDGLFATTA